MIEMGYRFRQQGIYDPAVIPRAGGISRMFKISSKQFGEDIVVMQVTDEGRDIWTFEVDEEWSGCGVGPAHVWVGDRSGTITLYDVASRTKSAEIFIPHGNVPRSTSFSKDGRRLYVVEPVEEDGTSTLYVIDIAAGRIVARHPGLPGYCHHGATERPDGRTLLLLNRRPSVGGIWVVTVDLEHGDQAVEVLGDGPPSDYAIRSPDGQYLLRRDLTVLPRRTVGAAPRGSLGFGRRGVEDGEVHFGIVWQVWEASPLRFVRRIVAQWMRAEELLDACYFGARLAPDAAKRARQALWEAISAAMTAANAPPEGGPPGREWFRSPPFLTEDAVRLAEDSIDVFRTSALIANFQGWQPDGSAFWVATSNYLTCVGLDGSVSPRLYLERKGLESTPVLAKACTFKHVGPLDDRKAEVCYADGTAIIDGAPSTQIVQAVSTDADHWRAAPSPPPDPRGNVLVIPLAAWTSAAAAEAIDALSAEMTLALADRAIESEIRISFQRDDESIAEAAFFDRVADEFPNCGPALRRLVDRFVAVAIERHFLFSDSDNGHGLLSHAVLALGLLDREALPLVQSYGRVVDREHEYDFAGLIVPRLIQMHRWSDAMIDFVFWVLIRNYFNALQDFAVVWVDWGLRDALVGKEPAAMARHIVERNRRDLKSGRFAAGRRKGGLAQLAADVAKPHEPWLATFLREAKRHLAV